MQKVQQPRKGYGAKSGYEAYMEEEGIPVFEAVAGVDDVTDLPRKPWARMGGSGTFIQMVSTIQAERGIYIAEIPGGGALNPEKHLYEEAILILQGRGVTEVWQEGSPKRRRANYSPRPREGERDAQAWRGRRPRPS